MNKCLHTICIVISIVSLLFICVDEELITGFIPCLDCINSKGINGVMSVVGGSFIAGYIFFLLTCEIPNYTKKKETNTLILLHAKALHSWVEVCNEPITNLRMKVKDLNDDVVVYSQDEQYIQIHHQLVRLDEEAKPLVIDSLQPIYRYFTYLTPNQQKEIEKINGSTLFIWANHLKEKHQLYIKEVKILISHYDGLKDSADILLKSVQ